MGEFINEKEKRVIMAQIAKAKIDEIFNNNGGYTPTAVSDVKKFLESFDMDIKG